MKKYYYVQCFKLTLFVLFLASGMMAAFLPALAKEPFPSVLVQDRAPIKISGLVTDENGGPLPGVTVKVKGTQITAITDVAGKYIITANSENDILIFSYLSFTTQELKINNSGIVNVKMLPSNRSLTEVVVVGYGTQIKRDITGAVASVSAKDIQQVAVTSIDQAVQGRMAGVQVSSTSGAPGGNTNFLVRGVGSVSGSSEPLIVIDGFPASTEIFNALNPNEIESMEVLKDASATAIYGSRGANGVVMITTKLGKAGKSKINVDVYNGLQQVAKKIKMMNAQEYAEILVEGRTTAANESGVPVVIPPRFANPQAAGVGTDWQDAFFRVAPIQSYQVNANGGDSKTRYAISGGYLNQQGVIIKSGFERFSGRANIESNLNKRLTVGARFAPSYTNTNMVKAGGHYTDLNIILSALAMPPDIPVYRQDGSYGNEIPATDGQVTVQNPVKIANELKNVTTQFNFLGNAFAEYEFLKSLKLRVSLGTQYSNSKNNYYKPSTLSANSVSAPALASYLQSEDISWINENTLSYKFDLGQKHVFNSIVGYTIQKFTSTDAGVTATNFPDDLVQNVSGGSLFSKASDLKEQWSLLSYLARINYAYDNKYLFTASFRSDGSSRFGANHKWGTFPSASVGWRLSEEKFLKPITFLNDLKLRASYGITGNNNIGNYRHIALLGAANYILGDNLVPGLARSTLSNTDLSWEKNREIDFGVDFSVLNNRIEFTGDYYNRKSTNMLLNVSVPAVTGLTNAFVNIGSMNNKGVELSLTTRNLTKKFVWTTNFNITFNKNRVLELGSQGEQIFGDAGRGNTNVTQVGQPIGAFYGHVFEGIFLTQEDLNNHAKQAGAKLGDAMFKDVDNNGVVNDQDRTIIGKPQPDLYFGFNNSFAYKNFSLDLFLNGMSGNDLFMATGIFIQNFAGVQNELKSVYDNRWRSPEQPGDGNTPRILRGAANNNSRFSSYYIKDGSLIRVRALNLGYNLPQKWASKIKVQTARIYLSATNLYTFSRYPGYDPEVSNSDKDLTAAGVDYGNYPLPRTFTLGVNLSL